MVKMLIQTQVFIMMFMKKILQHGIKHLEVLLVLMVVLLVNQKLVTNCTSEQLTTTCELMCLKNVSPTRLVAYA